MRFTRSSVLLALGAATSAYAATPLPSDLVGEWRWTSISGVTYWDTRSSAYLGHGGGMSDTLLVDKDGTYTEYSFIEQSPTAGWTVRTFTTIKGRVDVEKGFVRFTAPKGSYKVEDNRAASRSYERPMTADEVKKQVKVYRYEVREKDGKKTFVKMFPKEEMKYERIR